MPKSFRFFWCFLQWLNQNKNKWSQCMPFNRESFSRLVTSNGGLVHATACSLNLLASQVLFKERNFLPNVMQLHTKQIKYFFLWKTYLHVVAFGKEGFLNCLRLILESVLKKSTVQPPSPLELPGPLTPTLAENFQFPLWWRYGYFLELPTFCLALQPEDWNTK